VKLKTIAAIAFVAVFFTRTARAEGEATPVKIIYETDMESDVDDAATLAMLHILADAGECEILAVMHNTSDDYGVGVIDAINTYYGRGDLPIGAYKSDDAPSSQFGGAMHYAKSIALDDRFPKDVVTRDDVPDAYDLYRQILSERSEASVIIVSVGWLTNLRNLLRDQEGRQLVSRRVKKLFLMGGRWDPVDVSHTATMNLAGNQIIAAAYEAGRIVVEDWPTPIVFSGLSIGGHVPTGEKLKSTPLKNPVREAYRICKKRHRQENWSHASWDQTAALVAVRGLGTFWQLNTQGTPRMFLEPNEKHRYLRWHTKWDSSVDSPHAYLRFAADPKEIAAVIEGLMIQPPRVSEELSDK
jgi:inosine-uridine nucleoside N-ribohydrolase